MSRVVSMIAFLVSLLFSQITYANDCNIKIADMNWGSATLMANVDKIILERGYDCKVDLVVGDTVPTFTSMMNKSTPDMAPEMWASTVTTLLKKAEREGKLTTVNNNPINGLSEGWYVTPGTLKRHPELKTVMDVIDNPHLFPHPEDPSKGAFVNCPIGWGCQKSNLNLFRAFDMESKGWKILDPGSSAGLDGTIAKASLRGQNWFGFYWTPQPLVAKYNMQELDWGIQYAGDDNWNNCIVKSVEECTDPKPSAWTKPVVNTIITNKYKDRAKHDTINYLENRIWKTSVINDVLNYMESNKLEGGDAANYFLVEYPDLWKQWVSEKAQQKIKNSL